MVCPCLMWHCIIFFNGITETVLLTVWPGSWWKKENNHIDCLKLVKTNVFKTSSTYLCTCFMMWKEKSCILRQNSVLWVAAMNSESSTDSAQMFVKSLCEFNGRENVAWQWVCAPGGSIALTNLVCNGICYIIGTGIPNYIFYFINIKMNFIEGLNLLWVYIFFNYVL